MVSFSSTPWQLFFCLVLQIKKTENSKATSVASVSHFGTITLNLSAPPAPPQAANGSLNEFSFPDPAAISSLPLLNYKCIYSTVKRMSIAEFPAAGWATVCGGHRGKGSNAGQSQVCLHVSLPSTQRIKTILYENVGLKLKMSFCPTLCSRASFVNNYRQARLL